MAWLRAAGDTERAGGRYLKIPPNAVKMIFSRSEKEAREVSRLILYLVLNGSRDGEDLVINTIVFNERYPTVAKYTEEEALDYVKRWIRLLGETSGSQKRD